MTFYKKISRPSRAKKSKINHTFFNCFVIGLLLLIVIAYLLQANSSISYSLRTKEVNSELETLKIENEYLVRKVTQLNSIANIYKISADLKMVKVARADYLTPTSETFAER